MNAAPAQAKPTPGQVGRQGSWRLGTRPRKTVLLLHVVAGGSWFGLDVAMAILVFTAIGTDSAAVARVHAAVAAAHHGLAHV